jgi:hypothetical protein
MYTAVEIRFSAGELAGTRSKEAVKSGGDSPESNKKKKKKLLLTKSRCQCTRTTISVSKDAISSTVSKLAGRRRWPRWELAAGWVRVSSFRRYSTYVRTCVCMYVCMYINKRRRYIYRAPDPWGVFFPCSPSAKQSKAGDNISLKKMTKGPAGRSSH